MKRLLVFAIVFVATLAAKAEYLYWMVGSDYTDQGATLKAVSSPDGTTESLDTYSASVVAETYGDGDVFATDLGTSTGSSWSYYIELTNGYKTDPIAYNDATAYLSKPGSIALPRSYESTAANTFGVGASYSPAAAPEPTSGILVLIGAALMGLRRRKIA